MKTAPYAFEGPYRHCYPPHANHGSMDRRHVFMIHGVLAAWPFKNALELGSLWGASSTAFIEAINAGASMIASFCDVIPTAGLFSVIDNCRDPGRARFTQQPSWEVLESAEDFDFVLVDANHDLQSVTAELDRLVIRKPLCVMAHDTSAAEAGYPHCEGAALLKRTFEAAPEYRCIEDCARREGERTERGLFLATTDGELYELAREIFAAYAAVEAI